MKYNCEVINDLLPLYVDDVLSAESKKIVEEHIAECEDCANKVKELKKNIDIPMNTERSGMKGLKKKFNKSVWVRTAIICFLVIVAWVAANIAIMTSEKEVWPRANAEGISESMEVVCIGEKLYIHTNALFGCGETMLSNGNTDPSVYKFFIGETGIHNLGLGRAYYGGEKFYAVGDANTINKIIYADPDGTEVVTLYEKGDVIPVLEGEVTNYDD